jgi:hypothetical protein
MGAAQPTTSDPEKSGRHEGTKTDVMVERIKNIGGFISLALHQGGRDRLQDISSAYGVPFDCGNSSQTWAQVYLYGTQDLGLPAVGFGSDFNGFSEWIAPRFGDGACSPALRSDEGQERRQHGPDQAPAVQRVWRECVQSVNHLAGDGDHADFDERQRHPRRFRQRERRQYLPLRRLGIHLQLVNEGISDRQVCVELHCDG